MKGITNEQSYRTSDGMLHTSISKAETHQRQLNFTEGLQKLTNEHVAYTDARDTVETFINDHSNELLELLMTAHQVDTI